MAISSLGCGCNGWDGSSHSGCCDCYGLRCNWGNLSNWCWGDHGGWLYCWCLGWGLCDLLSTTG